ncbi:MAG: tetratricopeptide repeat protein, partial [Gemmatimonadota bacterium]|nr:tetratricopeptide repeat protein [Gemmatimonadota bacterium]
ADPYSSRIALRLMQSLDRAGNPAGAVRHAAAHTAFVREDLGLEPDPDVPRYAEALRQRAPVETSPPPRPRVPVHSPASTTSVSLPAAVRSRTPPERPPTTQPTKWWARVAVAFAFVAAVWVIAYLPGSPTSPEESITSLMVLPFTDLSHEGTEERLADGITEELIARLSNTELRVMGRTSAFAYKGRSTDAREIGHSLGVGAVLNGSVRRSGDRLRISAQLENTSDGFELWSETYERNTADIFAIQDDIARAIVSRLTDTDADPAPLPRRPAADPEAYNLYLNGRFEWHKRTEAGLRSAVEYLEQALARAPEYARAHAGLGDAYAVLGFYDYLPPGEAFPKAAEAARRAIELDPLLAEPHATLGYVALYYGWDGEEAEGHFRRAIELSPGYSTGHQWYANLLTAQGRFEEAVVEMRTATELDPLSLIANTALGWVHYYQGDFAAALDQLDHARSLDPDFELAHLWTGLTLEAMGRTQASLNALRRTVDFARSAISRAALARGLALAGREDEARAMLVDLEAEAAGGYAPAFEIAKVHEALSQPDSAMAWLGRALEERSHSMVFLSVDPQLQGLRGRSDFQEMVRAVGMSR